MIGDGAHSLLGKLFSFGIAGVSGMIVDLGLLRLIIELFNSDPFIARIPAISAAMMTTWYINRNFTFGASARSIRIEGLRYIFVALACALLNYVLYSFLLVIFPKLLPELAVIIAVSVVTIFSYLGYSKFVFKRN